MAAKISCQNNRTLCLIVVVRAAALQTHPLMVALFGALAAKVVVLSAERRERAEAACASPDAGVPSECSVGARAWSAMPVNTAFTMDARSRRKPSICMRQLRHGHMARRYSYNVQ